MDLARNLKIESVSRLEPSAPLVLGPRDSVRSAVTLMQQRREGCVLVCVDKRLVGIFTERDLLKRVLGAGKPLGSPLSECMTTHPISVQTKESVGSALRQMQEGGYRHLPVVDEHGQPVGTLSVKRIVHYLVEHFPTVVYNLPPDPDLLPKNPDGA